MKLPKLIHFIWIGSSLPVWAERNIEEFRRLNPDHKIVLHNREFVPGRYREQWRDDLHPSTKSDLMRYKILRREGGWYFDVDYWPVRPLADAEHAFGLDGSRLFACWMNNPRINNGVLACGPNCKALDELDKVIFAGGERGTYGGRTAFGPPLITRLAKSSPDLVRIASWPWFHGVRDIHAAKVWRRCSRNGTDNSVLFDMMKETGGQLPFAFHLWAHTHGNRIEAMMDSRKLIAICGVTEGHDDSQRPYPYLAQGCEKLGYRTEVIPWNTQHIIDECSDVPEAVFVWNGLKGGHARNAEAARSVGARVIYMEYGFFQRNTHFQADHMGTLHRSSWAASVAESAPAEGAQRLAKFISCVNPMHCNRQGYVLVLGQVPNDSQLFDSELMGPIPLQRAVKRSLPDGIQAYFRPHPSCSNVVPSPHKVYIETMPTQINERSEYVRNKSGGGLAEALQGARFVVTINSNAIVEALIAGAPVLAFGPSLAINAGAVHATSLATLGRDLREMLDGWRPEPGRAENYLRWLASRQYRYDEFADSELVAGLLIEAGLDVWGAEKIAVRGET